MESEYAPLLPMAPATTTYLTPRLGPDGVEVVLVMTKDQKISIARSVLDSLTMKFGAPSELMLLEEDGVTPAAIGTGLSPSPPTKSSPRRMLLSSTVYDSPIDEYEEVNDTTWKRVYRHGPFGTVHFVGEATLSEDGRRMVFRGQITGLSPAAFYVERPSVTAAFAPAAGQLPTMNALVIYTPYLTSDCKHYYYTELSTNVIQHVTYP